MSTAPPTSAYQENAMADEKKQMNIKVALPKSLPPAEGANYFHITSANGEVQLLIGSISLNDLHDAAQSRRSELNITPDVSHRFLLSQSAFDRLRENIETVHSAMAKRKAEE